MRKELLLQCTGMVLGGTPEAKGPRLRLSWCELLEHRAMAVPCSSAAPAQPRQPQQKEKAPPASEPPPALTSAVPRRAEQPCTPAPCYQTKGCQPALGLGLAPEAAAECSLAASWSALGLCNSPFQLLALLPALAGPGVCQQPGSDAGAAGLRVGRDGRNCEPEQGLASVTGRESLPSCLFRSSWRCLLDWGWSDPEGPCRSSPGKCGDRNSVGIQARDVVAWGCWGQVTHKYPSEVAWA